MHLVFNIGSGDNAHWWCDMVCRGKGRESVIVKETLGITVQEPFDSTKHGLTNMT